MEQPTIPAVAPLELQEFAGGWSVLIHTTISLAHPATASNRRVPRQLARVGEAVPKAEAEGDEGADGEGKEQSN